jgi:hypothetical protein
MATHKTMVDKFLECILRRHVGEKLNQKNHIHIFKMKI